MLNIPKTVLVVDDEQLVKDTLVAILNLCDNEFAAVGTTSVVDALTIVRGIRPDLILLDVCMPGVEGLEHALEMRDECGCNVLLMSGAEPTAVFLDDLVQSGHRTFEIVPKPIAPQELIAIVRDMVGQAPNRVSQNPLQARFQAKGAS